MTYSSMGFVARLVAAMRGGSSEPGVVLKAGLAGRPAAASRTSGCGLPLVKPVPDGALTHANAWAIWD